ncbi:MAG: hypothetical protein B7Z35_14550 [Hydrogenophilales bacterium 12-61-10]|nr:MAG: hypothetical protein B7Z35_14550 [Hydrogenophilales bacterium 12-61-10]OYX30153.1 MAG: hypothetical protein B7Z03_07125 [Hydrogenophilales bacterium 32-62-9]
MPAFAVKHLAYERGPLIKIMKRVKAQPYSFTSKEPEASNAIGHYVFVIEVRKERGETTYWLGYKYRACDKVKPAGGGLWDSEFKFKNIASQPPDGAYFENPVQITDHRICNWLTTKQPGMAEIPPTLVPVLDELFPPAARMFANPSSSGTR